MSEASNGGGRAEGKRPGIAGRKTRTVSVQLRNDHEANGSTPVPDCKDPEMLFLVNYLAIPKPLGQKTPE